MSWQQEGSANSLVRALISADLGSGPTLYAGGMFSQFSSGGQNVAASYVAQRTGETWSPLGSGVNSWVLALAARDDGTGPAIYAGGMFTAAGDVEANFIAKWDGESWSPLGPGMDGFVTALAVFDAGDGEELYAAGTFTTAGGVPAHGMARWDGTSWSAVSDGPPRGAVHALAVFDDGSGQALYAGGAFKIGGWNYISLVKWDGTEWSVVGGGVNGVVRSLAVANDLSGAGSVLYIGGSFTQAGSVAVTRVASWNGAQWSALGEGLNDWVRSLTVFTSSGVSSLYAGGSFQQPPPEFPWTVVTWTGADWVQASPSTLAAWTMAVHEGDQAANALYVFNRGGWLWVWAGCYAADLNGDGVVDILDLLMLFAQWGPCPDGASCQGDLNGDDNVDVLDMLLLFTSWS